METWFASEGAEGGLPREDGLKKLAQALLDLFTNERKRRAGVAQVKAGAVLKPILLRKPNLISFSSSQTVVARPSLREVRRCARK